jgi:hypothetical protein
MASSNAGVAGTSAGSNSAHTRDRAAASSHVSKECLLFFCGLRAVAWFNAGGRPARSALVFSRYSRSPSVSATERRFLLKYQRVGSHCALAATEIVGSD